MTEEVKLVFGPLEILHYKSASSNKDTFSISGNTGLGRFWLFITNFSSPSLSWD